MTDTSDHPRIVKLPKMVVDRIAAGEVVQRPSSVIKELIENCLDADSSYVAVSIEKGGLHKMTVTDNGCGIAKEDMPLVAARFATSKLTKVEDLQSIESFGFRGEALASTSLVSRLHIVSRRKTEPTAFQCSYTDGAPTGKAKPVAGKQGTIVTVSDLFYNLPHRRKMNERDEYQRILSVMQRYALHHASEGIGFVCSKRTKGSETYDLNTANMPVVKNLTEKKQKRHAYNEKSSSIPFIDEDEMDNATRKVFAQIFGSKLEDHLLLLKCESKEKATSSASNDDTTTSALDQNQCQYSARGFLINPSQEPPKGCSGLVLFVNDRLVESPFLKRTIDGIYAGFTKSKPIAYLTIKVPGNQVDVNVHPTKRQVALLYEEEIFEDMAKSIKELLSSSVRSFEPTKLLPNTGKVSSSSSSSSAGKKRPNPSTGDSPALTSGAPASAKKRSIDPTKLVRTTKSAISGAIEPYLVQTQDRETPKSSTPNVLTPSTDGSDSSNTVIHDPSCPLASSDKMDLSTPGAFVNFICQCQVSVGAKDGKMAIIRSRRQVMVRPKKVVPTECMYKSIQSLRTRVAKQADKELARRLRESMLVGVLSQRRCLVQCGAELLIWNHFELARELFYQLALARFGGGAELGRLGSHGGVDVKCAIEQALQLEESIATAEANSRPCSPSATPLKVSEINSRLAEQATTCLFDNSEMLEEYFSIRLIRKSTDSSVMLEALPVLLEGYAPQPYGLPLFLLRLATEVDWMDEEPCFEGVCRELGSYYAHVPLVRRPSTLVSSNTEHESVTRSSSNDNGSAIPATDLEADKFVRHALFPAISYLLVPPKKFVGSGTVSELALLSSLYKVFERC